MLSATFGLHCRNQLGIVSFNSHHEITKENLNIMNLLVIFAKFLFSFYLEMYA